MRDYFDTKVYKKNLVTLKYYQLEFTYIEILI